MARGDPQINLRLPGDLKAWLESQAQTNLRSISGEVVLALREKRERITETAEHSAKSASAA